MQPQTKDNNLKVITKTVLIMALILITSGAAFAETAFNAQGSTLIPSVVSRYRDSASSEWTVIKLSNITNQAIQCNVIVYDHDGNEVITGMRIESGASGGIGTVVSSGTGLFEIPAHSTRYYQLGSGNSVHTIYGYAVVEWKSDDPQQRKALIGGVEKSRVSGNNVLKGEVLINNGQPF